MPASSSALHSSRIDCAVQRTSLWTSQGEGVSEVEVQQDLQRFAGQFIDLVTQALSSSFDPADAAQHEVALRRALLYDSAVLDIASGPIPEVDLLDMLVFISLSRSSVELHWVPNVFRERGAPLAAAFAQAERKIWTISAKVLPPDQVRELRAMIAQWREEHPDQVPVESVRFTDFSTHAGKADSDRSKSVSGLFGGMKSATNAADRALLLADRAMFLAQRMPFLIRAQVRLGALEVTEDALTHLRELDTLGARLTHAIDTSDQLADKALTLLDRGEKLAASSQHSLRLATEHIDRWVRRWVVYLIILGAAWSLFLWGGYYLVKR
jgi:hypothetical protein